MHIERVRTASPEILAALGRLIPQLTSNNPAPNADYLEDLLGDESNVLIAVRHPDAQSAIVGVGCLGIYRVTTGVRAVIEDVVVDGSARGLGLGEAITRRLLEIAREMGAPGVSLTSNPHRVEANRLYLRMGFSPRRTNCYYYTFE